MRLKLFLAATALSLSPVVLSANTGIEQPLTPPPSASTNVAPASTSQNTSTANTATSAPVAAPTTPAPDNAEPIGTYASGGETVPEGLAPAVSNLVGNQIVDQMLEKAFELIEKYGNVPGALFNKALGRVNVVYSLAEPYLDVEKARALNGAFEVYRDGKEGYGGMPSNPRRNSALAEAMEANDYTDPALKKSKRQGN